MNILSESAMSMSEVKAVLEKVKKKEGELNFRAQKTLDHLIHAKPLAPKKAQELYDKIVKLEVSRMREQYIKKLIDTLPTKEKDAKLILQGFNVTIASKDLKEIVAVINEYVTA